MPDLGIHLTASVPIHIQSAEAPLVEINLPTDLLLQPGSTGKKDCSASAYLSALVLDNKGHRDLSFFWVITKDDEPLESYHETPGRVCFETGEYTVTLFAVSESGAQSEVAVRTISVKDTSDEDFESVRRIASDVGCGVGAPIICGLARCHSGDIDRTADPLVRVKIRHGELIRKLPIGLQRDPFPKHNPLAQSRILLALPPPF